MKSTIDCKIYRNKTDLLTEFKNIFNEMYSINYDSLIDGARGFDQEITITIINIDCYEDEKNLREILKIISQENPLINIRFN